MNIVYKINFSDPIGILIINVITFIKVGNIQKMNMRLIRLPPDYNIITNN